MARKRRGRRSVLEKRPDGYYENGKKLEEKDYIFHFNCQHGNSIISGLTGNKYFLDSRRRPI